MTALAEEEPVEPATGPRCGFNRWNPLSRPTDVAQVADLEAACHLKGRFFPRRMRTLCPMRQERFLQHGLSDPDSTALNPPKRTLAISSGRPSVVDKTGYPIRVVE